MIAIIISGKSGSGKDEAAKIIKSVLDKKYHFSSFIFHYADILKCFLKSSLNWNGKKDEDGRSLLQHWGTDIMRKKNENTFTDIMISMIKALDDTFDFIIIPDARFVNECDEIKKVTDTITIRITRKEQNTLTEKQKEHISETELDNYDFNYYIENSGSLTELKHNICKILDLNI